MKQLACFLIIIGFAFGCGGADEASGQFPEWKASVKVTDESGQPISGADMTIYYDLPSKNHEIVHLSKKGKTDKNGIFTASGRTTSVSLDFQATKEGFYKTDLEHDLGPFINPDPVKWNPNVALVLKRIGQPIAMYAKRLNIYVPVLDKPVGFDLSVGDWVEPFGKGLKTDIIFAGQHIKKAPQDYEDKLAVTFPNEGDGIQGFSASFKLMEGSALRSPHEAPESGYEPQLVKRNVSVPNQPLIYDFDAKTNYFFRVRTVLDEHGNIKSALYGKIYGDFMQFTYYLNPVANSRNMEFDTNQNLFKAKDLRDRSVRILMP
jgi:hypothetical protein